MMANALRWHLKGAQGKVRRWHVCVVGSRFTGVAQREACPCPLPVPRWRGLQAVSTLSQHRFLMASTTVPGQGSSPVPQRVASCARLNVIVREVHHCGAAFLDSWARTRMSRELSSTVLGPTSLGLACSGANGSSTASVDGVGL